MYDHKQCFHKNGPIARGNTQFFIPFIFYFITPLFFPFTIGVASSKIWLVLKPEKLLTQAIHPNAPTHNSVLQYKVNEQ